MSKTNLGGVSNTPQSNTGSDYTVDVVREKQVLFDWLSITTTFIDIVFDNGLYLLNTNQKAFSELVLLLGHKGPMTDLKTGNGGNGYRCSYIIGEHIKLLYGSESTKKDDKYTVNVLMSGQACREFELYLDGDYIKLFSHLIQFSDTAFKRVDIAIDIFDPNDLNIYDLKYYFDNDYFVSPMQSVQFNYSRKARVSSGFTIYVGSPGSNQIVLYDKKLERFNKKCSTII